MTIKLRLVPRAALIARVSPHLPASINGGSGIEATYSGGAWTVGLDTGSLTEAITIAVGDRDNTLVATYNEDTDTYRKVAIDTLVGVGTIAQAWDADLDALAANSTDGLWAHTGAGTGAARTITAGALLGVTNGDGVAGNPTVAITDAELVAIGGLTSAADKGIQFTGSGTAATYDLTTAGKALLDDADATAQRVTLGLVIGTNVQAFDADLAALAANSTDGLWAHTGAGTGAARSLANATAGITWTNPAGIAGNPTPVLANDLSALEGLGSTGIARRTGSDAWSVGTLVTNAELATAAAYTLKGNATGSAASVTDFTITGLTHKAIPTGSDRIMISDEAASSALKYSTITEIAAAAVAGVSSINNLTGAVSFPFVPAGRVTLTTGVPLTSSDVTGAATIYYTAAGGMYVPVYDGSSWRGIDISSDLSLALDSDTGHTGYQQSGKNHDVWVAYVSGATYFGTGPTWNAGAGAGSDTARGTGAASSELENKNGVPTNKNSMTLRHGSSSGNTVTVPANQATLLGTIRMTANGVTEDSAVKRFVSNAYNLEPRRLLRVDTTDTWNYSTGAWQQANASASNQVEWVHCLAGRSVTLDVLGQVTNSTATLRNIAVGIGIDSVATNSAQRVYKNTATNAETRASQSFYEGEPGLGYHRGTWLEMGGGADTQTWYGDAGLGINGVPPIQSGIAGRTRN